MNKIQQTGDKEGLEHSIGHGPHKSFRHQGKIGVRRSPTPAAMTRREAQSCSEHCSGSRSTAPGSLACQEMPFQEMLSTLVPCPGQGALLHQGMEGDSLHCLERMTDCWARTLRLFFHCFVKSRKKGAPRDALRL